MRFTISPDGSIPDRAVNSDIAVHDSYPARDT